MINPILPSYSRANLRFTEGHGSWLISDKGKKYLDMGAGIAVNSLGHAHPELVKSLKAQADKLWHTSNLYNIPNQEKLAKELVDATFADTVFFTNSGTESMECAIKMARKYHHENGAVERKEIITFSDSFHGRSLGMISATGSKKLTEGFEPILTGFKQGQINNYESVANNITLTTAAILIEPIQGEGGIITSDITFLKNIRKLCDEHGILLIFDEIQCGMGRTGKLFAYQNYGVLPDIMAIAKGLGGGFPLGACLATEVAAKGMTAGTHGSTYGGNPLACAVGNTVLKIINNEKFLKDVNKKSIILTQKLACLIDEHPEIFEEVRGMGLMLGIKCKVPNIDVVNAGYHEGILTVPGGQNIIRLLPPLNITTQEIKIALKMLDKCAIALKKKQTK
jgi:acetylornithine/N-succinyldiaminopimelate aminotransferase